MGLFVAALNIHVYFFLFFVYPFFFKVTFGLHKKDNTYFFFTEPGGYINRLHKEFYVFRGYMKRLHKHFLILGFHKVLLEVFVNTPSFHKKGVKLTLFQKEVLRKKMVQGLHKMNTNASLTIIVTFLK